jgi:hypothetical protein
MLYLICLLIGQCPKGIDPNQIRADLEVWLGKPPVSKWRLFLRSTSDPARKEILGEIDKDGKLKFGPYYLEGQKMSAMRDDFRKMDPKAQAARVGEVDAWLGAIKEKSEAISGELAKAKKERDLHQKRFKLGGAGGKALEASKAKVLGLENQKAALDLLRQETTRARETCEP